MQEVHIVTCVIYSLLLHQATTSISARLTSSILGARAYLANRVRQYKKYPRKLIPNNTHDDLHFDLFLLSNLVPELDTAYIFSFQLLKHEYVNKTVCKNQVSNS